MENLPKGDADVEDAHAAYGTTDPARSHHTLQAVHSGLTRGIQKEIIIAPITNSQRAMWNPRQKSQYQTDLEAQDNIENDAKFS